MRNNLKYYIILSLALALLIFVKLSAPEEIDWSSSYSQKDKIPFGDYILYDLLPDIFPGKKITSVNFPVYNLLNDESFYNTNYIFINDNFMPDKLDRDLLFFYAEDGNNVFIAANFIEQNFLDTLGIKLISDFSFNDTSYINFTDLHIKRSEDYRFKRGFFGAYFSEYDSSSTFVLGKNKKGYANFIMIPYGDGEIFINSMPHVFTNYNLLEKENNDYILKALSYLPVRNTFWDEYYKAANKLAGTPLRFILSQESLMWSYYLLIISVIIYIAFEGKRKQRIIPVIKPLKNTTVAFVETIGKLYYEQKDHKNIAGKKITYFLDFIRTRYFIKTSELNDETIKRISEKSGIGPGKVSQLFNLISWISKQKNIKESDLLELNDLIQTFYKQSGYHGRTK